jgi:hypothetical protein
VIDPIDEDERKRLLDELIVERFGRAPKWPSTDESPQVIARRRRVLCSLDCERVKRRRAA